MSRWSADPDVPRGAQYDERFVRLAESGADVHGEADLVAALLHRQGPSGSAGHQRSVLDAGCGTGRVAIELASRGFEVTGADLDPGMLDAARAKAPDLAWHHADLGSIDLARTFDAVVLAGNVLIFVAPGSETDVIARCAAHLTPGGLLVSGFQVRPTCFAPADLDRATASAGLALVDRWADWDRAPWPGNGTYQVSVHQRP